MSTVYDNIVGGKKSEIYFTMYLQAFMHTFRIIDTKLNHTHTHTHTHLLLREVTDIYAYYT